ncbi:MAG: hypothetical protein ACKVQA_06825 [Burkholderiales bacterium]
MSQKRDKKTKSLKIDPALEAAAHILQERLRTDSIIRESGIAPWRPLPEEWEILSPRARSGVPAWLPQLLDRFDFCEVEFQLPHPEPEAGYDLLFGFYFPQCYEQEVVGWIADLPSFGFYAFAGEGDGNLWVATAANGPSGDIYLLGSSGWDGTQPSSENGLIHASTSLAALLPRLSVSNIYERKA